MAYGGQSTKYYLNTALPINIMARGEIHQRISYVFHSQHLDEDEKKEQMVCARKPGDLEEKLKQVMISLPTTK